MMIIKHKITDLTVFTIRYFLYILYIYIYDSPCLRLNASITRYICWVFPVMNLIIRSHPVQTKFLKICICICILLPLLRTIYIYIYIYSYELGSTAKPPFKAALITEFLKLRCQEEEEEEEKVEQQQLQL